MQLLHDKVSLYCPRTEYRQLTTKIVIDSFYYWSKFANRLTNMINIIFMLVSTNTQRKINEMNGVT